MAKTFVYADRTSQQGGVLQNDLRFSLSVEVPLVTKDKTFTCTLFAPTSELERLTSRAAASTWFKTHFIDAVNLIGEEILLNDFQRNPRSSLVSLKVRYIYRTAYIYAGLSC